MGYEGTLYILFDFFFLHNRQIKVCISGTYSEIENLNTGIPQGSVLSCTCFMIAINEIANKLPPNLHKTVYVDDFAIYGSGETHAQ